MRIAIGIVMLAMLVGGCADATPTSPARGPSTIPSAPSSASPSPEANPDPRSSVLPGVVPAPHWAIPGIDAGNIAMPSPGPNGLIDRAWSWGDVAWSPDGQVLAAAAQSQEAGEGQIHLFDRTGHPIGAVPGFAEAWVDDHDLVTAESNADGVTNSVWRWSIDAKSSALLDPASIDFLSDGRGSVAISEWSDATELQTSFRLWTSQGGLGSLRPGEPAAWSGDGRKLAIQHVAGTNLGSSHGGITLAAGGPPPTWLEVLDGSTMRRLAAFPNDPFDARTMVLFDPSGTYVATNSFVFDLARDVAVSLPAQDEAIAWSQDGRLLVAEFASRTVRPWDPTTRTLGQPFAPGARLRTSDGQLLVVPPRTADLPPQLVVSGISPDGSLQAWYPDTGGDTPLWLVPAPTATYGTVPTPAPVPS
jgi:WD40 repeat protein